ncbi:MAG: hypothetical protein AAFU79_20050 [Myxococcota bacterium]
MAGFRARQRLQTHDRSDLGALDEGRSVEPGRAWRPEMKPGLLRRALLITLPSLLASSAADAHRPRPPLFIGFDAPRNGAIQYRSGWKLSVLITPRDPQGFDVISPSNQPFPAEGEEAGLLLQDLDGCPSVIDATCPSIPGDEIVFPFTADQDVPFIADGQGNPSLRNQLATAAGRPVFRYEGREIVVGPGIQPPVVSLPGGNLGEFDGIGYGANDDLPGLVLLSDTGVGRVLTSTLGVAGAVTGFDPLPTVRARNLAGLMTEVGFDLRRASRRTVVSTSLVVPENLFSPLVLFDECFSNGAPFCEIEEGSGAWRIDGGTLRPVERSIVDSFDFDTSPSPNVVDIEIRAVVVEGTAPTFVEDCNGDGQVTADDLRCEGYNVLSNEAVRTVTVGGFFLDCALQSELSSGAFGGPGANLIAVDFDQSQIVGSILCPTGGGRTTQPPN